MSARQRKGRERERERATEGERLRSPVCGARESEGGRESGRRREAQSETSNQASAADGACDLYITGQQDCHAASRLPCRQSKTI